MSTSDMDQIYKINEPAIVADMIDGEIIIMNLERGAYYSLEGIGAIYWRLILDGYPIGQIAEAAAARHAVPPDKVVADLAALVTSLGEHGIIVAKVGASPPAAPPDGLFPSTPYRPPALSVFSDMKDLLAFDPPLPGYRIEAQG